MMVPLLAVAVGCLRETDDPGPESTMRVLLRAVQQSMAEAPESRLVHACEAGELDRDCDVLAEARLFAAAGNHRAFVESSVEAWIAEAGEDVVFAAVLDGLTTMRDPVDRIALLTASGVGTLRTRQLPAELYDDVEERPVPEALALLRRSDASPLPVDALANVRAVAVDPGVDRRVRRAAITALAHAETAEALGAVALQVAAQPAQTRALSRALGRCGYDCVDVIAQLASRQEPELRELAVAAVLRSRPWDRGRIREHVTTLAPQIDAALEARAVAQ